MISKTRRAGKTGRSNRLLLRENRTAIAVILIALGLVAFALIVSAQTPITGGNYGEMAAMMSGYAANQNGSNGMSGMSIEACNQMMAGFGLNQSTISEMDNLMSNGAMSSMMGSMMGSTTGHTH